MPRDQLRRARPTSFTPRHIGETLRSDVSRGQGPPLRKKGEQPQGEQPQGEQQQEGGWRKIVGNALMQFTRLNPTWKQEELAQVQTLARFSPQAAVDYWNSGPLGAIAGSVNYEGQEGDWHIIKGQRGYFRASPDFDKIEPIEYGGEPVKAGEEQYGQRVRDKARALGISPAEVIQQEEAEPTAGEESQVRKNSLFVEALKTGIMPYTSMMGQYLQQPIEDDADIVFALQKLGADPRDPEVRKAIKQYKISLGKKEAEAEEETKGLLGGIKTELFGEEEETQETEKAPQPRREPLKDFSSLSVETLLELAETGDDRAYKELKRRKVIK